MARLAIAAYAVALDVAQVLGERLLAGPALGLIASGAGLTSVFLVSTLVVRCSAAISVRLLYAHSATQ